MIKKKATITFEYTNLLTPESSKACFELVAGDGEILGLFPYERAPGEMGYKNVTVHVEEIKDPAEIAAEEIQREWGLDISIIAIPKMAEIIRRVMVKGEECPS